MKHADRTLAMVGLVIGCAILMGPRCSDDDGTDAEGLRWFRTCGDPVCRGHTSDPALSACDATQVAGNPCVDDGARCDPDDPCNVRLLCASDDPTAQPGGCPISRARYKRDIAYLDDAGRARIAQQLQGLRLATYRYELSGPGAANQLGFIIDDVGDGVMVNPGGDTVNLYGYTSMAVATIQAQAVQLDELTGQVELLRREVQELRDARR